MVARKQAFALLGVDHELAMAPIEGQIDVFGHPAPEIFLDDETVDHDIDVVAFVLVEIAHFFEELELAIDPQTLKTLGLDLSSVSF
jgi:hypothetical protein